ncbi:beta-ketoacyl synthase N-terminal-like domain-containing protein [Streptomyces sp. NPDC008121]|uniref:beta-ketoacyl-[acyl-carrier-protein] synthase family protein n=1 Tax=Streptomyces sp. NPDC008121 TaxID=3364809 RepID=UPI0036ED578E
MGPGQPLPSQRQHPAPAVTAHMNRLRAVITGIGMLAPGGTGLTQFWQTVFSGNSQVRQDPRMASLGLASTVSAPLSQASSTALDDAAGHSRLERLAAASSAMAAADAALPHLHDAGYIFSSTLGGICEVQYAYQRATDNGQAPLQGHRARPEFYNAVSIDHIPASFARARQMHGPCLALSTGCSTGLDALGLAVDLIREGTAPVMLVGAADSLLSELPCAMMDALGVLSRYPGPARGASRPFSQDRSGFVVSEGSACLVIEEMEHARTRQRPAYAEITGFHSLMNAYHMTHLPPDGAAMAETVRGALHDAATDSSEIDCVFAHGTGTRQNDVFETRAFHTVFGPRAPGTPVISVKSVLGHAHAPANLHSVIAAAGAMRWAMLPPTINIGIPDPDCDLDYVPHHARPADIQTALITASGLGGYHSAAVLRSASTKNLTA